MVHRRDYETLCGGTLSTGSDDKGLYRTADFGHENAYVSAMKREDHYTVDWTSDMRLKDIYRRLEESHPVDNLVHAMLNDGVQTFIEPDGWKGYGHNDLKKADFNYEDFNLTWRPMKIQEAESSSRRLSVITLESDKDSNISDHAEPLYPLLTIQELKEKSCRKVFNDISQFLEEGF